MDRIFFVLALLCAVVVSLGTAGMSHAADIAIIDYADEWTQSAALGPCLDEYGYQYDDITGDVEDGNMNLAGYRLLFMSAMYTNNSSLHQGVDANADVIQNFVKGGGIAIEPTQADQNEANVDWLPSGLTCVRSDPDPSAFKIEVPGHLVFNQPNKFTEDEFVGWTHQGWPTGWEVIASQSGFDILMSESGTGKPIVMEAAYGDGMFVMMCMAPDKYHIVGNDAATKEGAGMFFENIMFAWYDAFSPVESKGKMAVAWGQLKKF